jgi:hypothetical protein
MTLLSDILEKILNYPFLLIKAIFHCLNQAWAKWDTWVKFDTGL